MTTTPATIPPLEITTRGEVLASNVDHFREAVAHYLAGINRAPTTDEEFGQAELDAKTLRAAEAGISAAKAKAIAGATPIQDLFAALDTAAADLRAARLDLERTIESRKQEVKAAIVREALDTIPAPTTTRQRYADQIREAMRGKRTLASMRAATMEAANAIGANLAACDALLDDFTAEHGPALVHDREALRCRFPDALQAVLTQRLQAHRNAIEQARLKEQLEAERAKQRAEAAPPPPPPPPPPAPKIPQPEQPQPNPYAAPAASAEWFDFRNLAKDHLTPIAAAGRALQDPHNRAAADAFGRAINEAWKQHILPH